MTKNRSNLKTTAIHLALILLLAAPFASAFASQSSRVLTGEVVSVDPELKLVVVHCKNSGRAELLGISLTDTARISKSGKTCTLNSIFEGDKVMVTYSSVEGELVGTALRLYNWARP